jgi:hypothetical protein
MPLLLFTLLLQIIFVIYVIKKHRNKAWVWVITMLPILGIMIFSAVELLYLTNEKYSTNKQKKETCNDEKESLITPFLAKQCYSQGLYIEAKKLYEQSLVEANLPKPQLYFGLAKASFKVNDFHASKKALNDLIKLNPDYKNQDAHLLYARTLEALEEIDDALHEYEVLCSYYHGNKAEFYFTTFLKKYVVKNTSNKHLKKIVSRTAQP